MTDEQKTSDAPTEGAEPRVAQIMREELVTARVDTTVAELAKLMTERDVRGVPIVAPGMRILGIVTDIDMVVRNTRLKLPRLVTFLDSVFYLEVPGAYEEKVRKMLGTTAEEIMSEPAVIAPQASIAELAELMVKERQNPILVEEDGALVGYVSRADVIRLMARVEIEGALTLLPEEGES